jgi:hypothetical protein
MLPFFKEAFRIFPFSRVSKGNFQKEIYARRSMLIKNKALRFVFLAIVLVLLAVGAFAFNTRTHAASPSASAATASGHVSILRQKVGYMFGQTATTVVHGVAFTLLNRTLIAQTVTYGGKTLLTIPAKSSANYIWKTAGSYKLGLSSNASASVTVTVS